MESVASGLMDEIEYLALYLGGYLREGGNERLLERALEIGKQEIIDSYQLGDEEVRDSYLAVNWEIDISRGILNIRPPFIETEESDPYIREFMVGIALVPRLLILLKVLYQIGGISLSLGSSQIPYRSPIGANVMVNGSITVSPTLKSISVIEIRASRPTVRRLIVTFDDLDDVDFMLKGEISESRWEEF